MKRIKYLVLAGVGLFVLLVYLYTIAPTVSFWDCGEFIAAAYILGVPHPPGTPFFVLFGRFWILLWQTFAAAIPLTKEVAFYMNMLSALAGIASSCLVYLIVLKIIRLKENKNTLIAIACAGGAAIINAFGHTFWFNSMESEVYTVSTLFATSITWLALHWYEGLLKGVHRDHLILFIFYLMFLATGMHLLPFLLIVPVYLFIFYAAKTYRKDLNFWALGIFQILIFFSLFISPDHLFTPSLIAALLLIVITLAYNFSNPVPKESQAFFIIGIVIILIAISTEYYLFLRAQSPMIRINECCPSNWQAFYDVLHRKQYEPFGILPRKTQIQTGLSLISGYFEQIKLYLKYFSWQFTFIPSIIGIWGFFEHYEKDKKTFVLLFIVFFMTSIALMTYLNLKFSPYDPNPMHQPREVRDRDYFFAPGFTFFTIFYGIGFAGLISKGFKLAKDYIKPNIINPIAIIIVLLVSLLPLRSNFAVNNRHHRWVAKDYGYNMLTACEDNSILFTNGDNDTFPLWFAQEVLGIKPSVIIANLSLINTNWYIKQLKAWGAPITFSNHQIDLLRPFYIMEQRRYLLVKDIMIRHLIGSNTGANLKNEDYVISQKEFADRYISGKQGKMNIYFATTVSEENFSGFRDYLKLEGLVYRIVPEKGIDQVDIEKTIDLFYNVFRYTGIFVPEDFKFLSKTLPNFEERKRKGEFPDYRITKNNDIKRLLSNYSAGLASLGHTHLVMAENLERLNDPNLQPAIDSLYNKVQEFWHFGYLFRPQEAYRFLANLGIMRYHQKDYAAALSYFLELEKLMPDNIRFLLQIGEVYSQMGVDDKALSYFNKAMSIDPRSPEPYKALLTFYYVRRDTMGMKNIMTQWIRYHPGDTSAQGLLKKLIEQGYKPQ